MPSFVVNPVEILPDLLCLPHWALALSGWGDQGALLSKLGLASEFIQMSKAGIGVRYAKGRRVCGAVPLGLQS